MTEPTHKPSALSVATDLLAPLVPRLLVAIAALRPGRPPQSLRALQPLALVFLLEAFGLATLLTDEQRRAAWQAARGPGRGKVDDESYDPTNDSDETKALRWVAARTAAEDKAYREHALGYAMNIGVIGSDWPGSTKRAVLNDFLKTNKAPNRADFSRQWGERNPIDPATAPACFDPRAQLSILDAVSPERDGALGLFMAESRLRAEAPPVLTYLGHTLDLTGCTSLADAAWRAVTEHWIVYLDHRGSTVGLRLLPPTDGIRVRLRAPLVNVLAADVEPAPSAPIKQDVYEARFEPTFEDAAAMSGTLLTQSDKEDLAEACDQTTALGFMIAPPGTYGPGDFGPDSFGGSDLPHAPTISNNGAEPTYYHSHMPVCPRCLDVTPGVPAGDPNAPFSGRLAETLCGPCGRALEHAKPARPIEFAVVPPGTFEREAAELRQRIMDLTIGDFVKLTSGPHAGRIAGICSVSGDKPEAQLVGRKVGVQDVTEVPGDAIDLIGEDPDDAPKPSQKSAKKSKPGAKRKESKS